MCQIRAGRGLYAWGCETVWNTLKESGIEKRGGETKILKRMRGGELGQEVGALKKGAGTPYKLWSIQIYINSTKVL